MSADVPASEPLDIGSRRELFVDDWLIERLDGEAELWLRRPTPAEVVLVHDEPWEGNASAYHSVFQDGDRYRMFYRAWHLGSSGRQLVPSRENLCYAESDDGIHWRKPRLGLVEFNGSKENNIVLSTDMADGMNLRVGGPAVFRDENPNAPTEARYKTLMTSRDPLGLVPLASADGLQGHYQEAQYVGDSARQNSVESLVQHVPGEPECSSCRDQDHASQHGDGSNPPRIGRFDWGHSH